jgi:predicted acetyltransferase
MQAKIPSTRIAVIPATREQQPIVVNLLELYAHDFSEFHDVELGEDGRFGYPDLSLYWSEPDRFPFLVRINDKLAGVILVRKGSRISANEAVWDMAEFFIVRRYRRRGIGTHIAHEIWRKFPGPWQIRVMQVNDSAHQFWAHAITAFAGDAFQSSTFEKAATKWHLFSFASPAHSTT